METRPAQGRHPRHPDLDAAASSLGAQVGSRVVARHGVAAVPDLWTADDEQDDGRQQDGDREPDHEAHVLAIPHPLEHSRVPAKEDRVRDSRDQQEQPDRDDHDDRAANEAHSNRSRRRSARPSSGSVARRTSHMYAINATMKGNSGATSESSFIGLRMAAAVTVSSGTFWNAELTARQ